MSCRKPGKRPLRAHSVNKLRGDLGATLPRFVPYLEEHEGRFELYEDPAPALVHGQEIDRSMANGEIAGWGTEDPKDGWGVPDEARTSPAREFEKSATPSVTPRAPTAIHPDRLRMMSGQPQQGPGLGGPSKQDRESLGRNGDGGWESKGHPTKDAPPHIA